MKKVLFVALALPILGCNNSKVEKNSNNSEERTLEIQLEGKSGTQVNGSVTFTQKGDVVTMNLKAYNLSQGIHAVHIHEKSDCSSPDATSTGGHWNPTKASHGKWGSEEGYHRGDIGNIVADDKGEATLSFQTNEWCLGCEDETKNILGHAIIIHEGADDFQTQPTGDAGGRVSCGGIIQ